MNFELAALYGLGSVPFIIGATEAIKRAFKVPAQYLPLMGLVLGAFFNVALAAQLGGAKWDGLFIGLIAGLMASGLYSGAKNTLRR